MTLGLWLTSLLGCLPELPLLEDPCAAWPDGGGLYRLPIDEDGKKRKPYVYVPGKKGPRDVIYVLHGLGMDGPSMVEVTGVLEEADRLNLVIVYPEGTGFPRQWNASALFEQDHDDVAFLELLASELEPRVCARRQFAMGFSNGAMMAQRWACEGEALDAFGGAAGPLMTKTCEGDPVPMRTYQGELDAVVPIEGGVNSSGLKGPSLDESMAFWRARNLCTGAEPTVTVEGDTTCTAFDCAAPTEACVIEGWGHQWPGGRNASLTDANATVELLQFFNRAVPFGDDDPTPPSDTGI
jgi:polyhydroxybutyrate depolymerase